MNKVKELIADIKEFADEHPICFGMIIGMLISAVITLIVGV